MTQEEKHLLIKALCEMFPYGVKVHIITHEWFYDEIEPYDRRLDCDVIRHVRTNEDTVKPYLRSLSSMTEEELKEFHACHCVYDLHPDFQPMMCNIANELNMFDWLSAHHFDIRGLIQKGLALEAPEGMYKTK